mmetsp:Transcript_11628/g.27098  ORF Transcript_11628/g.27098 Transcript_11628/m.27098 type:complete len:113 (+) Transcript_11628:99-437(+)
MAMQQASYDTIKQLAFERQLSPSVPLFLSCGAVAGACAQTAVYPLDVVRRRMQCGSAQEGQRHPTALETMRHVFRTQGLRGFTKGLSPAIGKVLPSVALSLVVRDACMGRLS